MKHLLAAGRFPNKRHTSGLAMVRAMLASRGRIPHGIIAVAEITDAVRSAYGRAVLEADPKATLAGNVWTLSTGATVELRAVRRAEVPHA